MPIDKSGSKESVGKNIKAELAAGRPKAQAVAIALDTQRRANDGAIRRKKSAKKLDDVIGGAMAKHGKGIA